MDLDAAPLLDWAGRRGGPLDPRAAEAVLGLLALSGARRRTGLPEPAPELVEELMLTLLPLYVSADPAELAGFPAVLVALIGYTHEAGKVNARRRDRLVAAVEALKPQVEAAMTSPRPPRGPGCTVSCCARRAPMPSTRRRSAPGWTSSRAVLAALGARPGGSR